MTARALSWLREGRDTGRPFFLLLVYSSPTLPFDPPEPFDSRFTDSWMSDEVIDRASGLWTPFARRINSGEIELGKADIDVIEALYDGELAYLDDKVGSLIDAMRDDGLLDSTHLVFTSDRGDDLGSGNRLADVASLSEVSLHVPMIIRRAGPGAEGIRARGLIQDVDLVPTLCDLLGVAPPSSISPVALTQAALDGSARRATAVSVAVRPVGPRVLDLFMSLRDQRYRYLVGPEGPISLLDLDVEAPGLEILESSPEIARTLQAQLASWSGMLAPPPAAAKRQPAQPPVEPPAEAPPEAESP